MFLQKLLRRNENRLVDIQPEYSAIELLRMAEHVKNAQINWKKDDIEKNYDSGKSAQYWNLFCNLKEEDTCEIIYLLERNKKKSTSTLFCSHKHISKAQKRSPWLLELSSSFSSLCWKIDPSYPTLHYLELVWEVSLTHTHPFFLLVNNSFVITLNDLIDLTG